MLKADHMFFHNLNEDSAVLFPPMPVPHLQGQGKAGVFQLGGMNFLGDKRQLCQHGAE